MLKKLLRNPPSPVKATIFCTFVAVLISIMADIYNLNMLPVDDRIWSILINASIPICIAGPAFFAVFKYLREISEDRLALEKLASTDSLTSVLNRGAFIMLVDAYLAEAKKQSDKADASLLMVDADHFKQINDTYGHQVGDDALRVLASIIRSSLRSADLVGRVGGEEFCVFLPSTDARIASEVAEAIRSGVNTVQFHAPGSNSLSVSIGGVSVRGRSSFESLFALADANLYHAKSTGRNRVVFT